MGVIDGVLTGVINQHTSLGLLINTIAVSNVD